MMVSLALAVDQEVKSEKEIPANGYVMGVSKMTSTSFTYADTI